MAGPVDARRHHRGDRRGLLPSGRRGHRWCRAPSQLTVERRHRGPGERRPGRAAAPDDRRAGDRAYVYVGSVRAAATAPRPSPSAVLPPTGAASRASPSAAPRGAADADRRRGHAQRAHRRRRAGRRAPSTAPAGRWRPMPPRPTPSPGSAPAATTSSGSGRRRAGKPVDRPADSRRPPRPAAGGARRRRQTEAARLRSTSTSRDRLRASTPSSPRGSVPLLGPAGADDRLRDAHHRPRRSTSRTRRLRPGPRRHPRRGHRRAARAGLSRRAPPGATRRASTAAPTRSRCGSTPSSRGWCC